MKIIRLLSFVLLLFVLVILGTLQFLPDYLSKEIIPTLAKENNLPYLAFDINTLGTNSIRFSHLRLGPNNKQAVYIDSGEISYTLKELFHGDIQALVINGLQFYVTSVNGKIEISGVHLPSQKKQPSAPTLSNKEFIAIFNSLPVRVADIQIKNSRCTIQGSGQTIEIPFDLNIHLANANIPHFDFTVKLAPFANQIMVTGIFDLVKNFFESDILADAFLLSNTNIFLQDLPINISATTRIKGRASGTIFPFAPKYNFMVNSDNFMADYKNLKFSVPPSVLNGRRSAAVKITGDCERLNAQVSGITLVRPITAIVDRIAVNLSKRATNLTGAGSLSLTIPPIHQNFISLLTPLSLSSTFDFEMNAKSIKGKSSTIIQSNDQSSSGEFTFIKEGRRIQVKPITISLSGETSSLSQNLRYKIISQQIHETIIAKNTTQSTTTLQGNTISLTGVLRKNLQEGNNTHTGEFTLSVKELTGTNTDFSAKTALKLIGKIDLQKNKDIFPNLSATLELNAAKLTLKKEKLILSGMTANIPFTMPLYQKNMREGSFDIPHIMIPGYDIGSLSGTIRSENDSYIFEASLLHKIIPGLTTHILANLAAGDKSHAPKAMISLTMPQYHFDSKEIDLPIFNDMEANGNIDIRGSLEISTKGISGNYKLKLTNTSLNAPGHDITVEGLNLDLKIPTVDIFKSRPSTLNFHKASLGNSVFSGGEVLFQLENSKDILIENSTINWSNGKIHILGTRVTTGVKRQDIILYCEGLNLAEVLSQLGVAKAQGDGRVNGKISLSIENGAFTLVDAFLYSTPGTGGTIQINNSEIILNGVPPTSVQYGQLDFASAALKNFKYQWVTLTLTPSQENTVLSLKLAGKPTMPLPFRYDTTIGTFIRLSEKNKKIDYPINLDVNFHLPLNKILNYGTNLKDIFTN